MKFYIHGIIIILNLLIILPLSLFSSIQILKRFRSFSPKRDDNTQTIPTKTGRIILKKFILDGVHFLLKIKLKEIFRDRTKM